MIKIELEINGEKKVFTKDKTYYRDMLEALKISKDFDKAKNIDIELFDKFNAFLIEMFDSKFTYDDLIDGLESAEVLPTIKGIINGILNGGESDPELKKA